MSSNDFCIGLGGNCKNSKKTAKEVNKKLPVPSVLIQPEFISKEYKEQRGISLLRGHLEQHWLHIYDYLRPSYSKRIGLKSSCRLFRDIEKIISKNPKCFSLKPLPCWTSFPHPKYSSLRGLFGRINELFG